MEQIDFIESVKVLKLKPGDVIVFETDQILNLKTIKMLKEQIEKITKAKALILGSGLEIGVLLRNA